MPRCRGAGYLFPRHPDTGDLVTVSGVNNHPITLRGLRSSRRSAPSARLDRGGKTSGRQSHLVQMPLTSVLAARTPARFRSNALAAVRENRWRGSGTRRVDWGPIVRLEGLIGVGSSCLAPGVDDVVAHVVAAGTNSRTENDVDIVDPCAKGGGHHRKRCANNIRDGAPPPGVGDADGRAATPGSGIDDQHWLAVGMQGHQHRADLVRHQRIAEPDLRRSRSWRRVRRAPSWRRGHPVRESDPA